MSERGIDPASRTRVTSELPDEASGPVQIRGVYGKVDGSMTDKVVNLVDNEERGTITVNGRL